MHARRHLVWNCTTARKLLWQGSCTAGGSRALTDEGVVEPVSEAVMLAGGVCSQVGGGQRHGRRGVRYLTDSPAQAALSQGSRAGMSRSSHDRRA